MPDYIRGERRDHPVVIADTDRLSHIGVIGKTGVGKSTLLLNLMCTDLKRGHGFGVLDPHGDLAEQLLDRVPRSRIPDVIYFNAGDLAFPVPFNVFDAVSHDQHHLVASGLVSILKRYWASAWGPRTEYLVRNAAFALLESPGATLLEVPRLLTDEDFRTQVAGAVENPAVKRFWLTEYAAYTSSFREEIIAPVQNKIGEFIMAPIIRNIVGQRKNLFDLRRMMDDGKILIVNLSKGAVGEDTAALLGSMMLTRILFAAFTRQDIPEAARRPFYLYVDEFPSFATQGTMSALLSEARKYKLGLTLSNQYLAQMSDEMRGALFGNIGTLLSYQLGGEDAEYVSREFDPVSPQELMELPNHHIFLKLKVNGVTSHAFSAKTLPPPPVTTSYRDDIIQRSRRFYARPRAIVERRNQGDSQGPP
ncbi:MAG: type IV secretion system DNA-binding domain-containing protein [Candidatus Binataceae bacterium]